MTLDDCDLPEVQAFLAWVETVRDRDEWHDWDSLVDAARIALAALYQKWQEAEAERDAFEAEADGFARGSP